MDLLAADMRMAYKKGKLKYDSEVVRLHLIANFMPMQIAAAQINDCAQYTAINL